MIKLELSLDEVNVILSGLGNMQYAHVATLFEKIKTQVAPQLEIAQPTSVVQ